LRVRFFSFLLHLSLFSISHLPKLFLGSRCSSTMLRRDEKGFCFQETELSVLLEKIYGKYIGVAPAGSSKKKSILVLYCCLTDNLIY